MDHIVGIVWLCLVHHRIKFIPSNNAMKAATSRVWGSSPSPNMACWAVEESTRRLTGMKHLWKTMKIDGKLWKTMQIDGKLWKTMKIDGKLWKAMEN